MQKLQRILPLFVTLIVIAPGLLIARGVANQSPTGADFALALPLVAYFAPLFIMARYVDPYAYFSREDKRGFRLLAVGMTVIFFIMWLMVLFSGNISLLLAVASTAGFGFGLYDLLRIINGLQKGSQLIKIVWVQFVAPLMVGLALFYATYALGWALIVNAVAAFFIMRACIIALSKPLVSPVRS